MEAGMSPVLDRPHQMPRTLAEANDRLRREQAAHIATRRELKAARRQRDQGAADAGADLGMFLNGRVEATLHGAKVCVFAQDRDFRYLRISGPLGEIPAQDILGRIDQEVMPPLDCRIAAAAKRLVLETGKSANCEVAYVCGESRALVALHIEPTFDARGETEGLLCAAVEITERKESEAHLRLLMREITHRSKNLLAVIQAMARQTARHSESIGAFLDRFGARLQALAQSHDLLVQQSWHGAWLRDLVRGQLRHYLDRGNEQIMIEGPPISLKPEAAQSLGLAVHELATNAAKYGSLSVPHGKVSILWRDLPQDGLEILWIEIGGPRVAASRRRGFGSIVIEDNLVRAIDADVTLDFRPGGLHCRIIVPAAQLTDPQERFAADGR